MFIMAWEALNLVEGRPLHDRRPCGLLANSAVTEGGPVFWRQLA